MALTFPRAFVDLEVPVSGVTSLKRFQAAAFDGDGGLGSVDVAPPVWSHQYSITAQGRDAIAKWRAFFASLRGGMRTFQGVPIRDGRKFYRWPLSRPTGFSGLTVDSSAWDGTGALTDIGESRDEITIGSLPNGLVLSYGDFISFSDGSVNLLHMILEGGTVALNSVTVTVEPTIRADISVSPAISIDFEHPYCTSYIAGEISETPNDLVSSTFSFTAYQKPR